MKNDLTTKNILVTGGSMGIGRAIAEACLSAGANVVICARSTAPLQATLKELRLNHGSRVEAVNADVTSTADINNALETLESRFGALSGVAHAAGIYGPIGSLDTVDPSDWLNTIRVNLFGTYIVAREACSKLKRNGGGRLVFLAGGGASAAFPNYTAYACSKAAVVRFVETLAIEMREHHIEANSIAPGFVVTRLHHKTLEAGLMAGEAFLERTKTALSRGEEVPASVAGDCAAFLLSQAALGITGKFVAAPYDHYKEWSKHPETINNDLFTLRRILPKDRGLDWQ